MFVALAATDDALMKCTLTATLSFCILALALAACGDDDDPVTPPPPPPPPADMGTTPPPPPVDMGPRPDTGPTPDGGPPTACEHADEDFDLASTADDGWAACVSDDGAFHLFSMDVSSFARAQAFDEIADLLWRRATPPTAEDFLAARELYSVDEGLGSRVVRRFDSHYPECPIADPPETRECARPGATEMCRDRCVGPAVLQPIILDAFMQGAMGMAPELNAARLEGALLNFFWVSTYKESASCAEVVADCDSSIGYYRGDTGLSGDGLSITPVEDAEMALSLARYVREADPAADDAIHEAHLAVRCWREMDNPTGPAMNTELHDQALDQLDRATLRAIAVVLRARIATFEEATGTAQAAHWEFIRIFGAGIVRGATERNAAMGAAIAGELAKTDPATVDGDVITTAIDALFPCAF